MELPLDDSRGGKPCCNAGAQENGRKADHEARESRLPCMTALLDFKLRRAQLLVYQDFTETLSRLKLRPAEFAVLAMIAKHPGRKQTTIAEGLGIKRANFVFLMDSIEARELAERRKDETDRRSHSLYLTEKGTAFVRQMTVLWQEHEDRMVAALGGPEERDRLIDLLNRLLVLPDSGSDDID
jgi:DNA-binding MarR family transcriptional regulator